MKGTEVWMKVAVAETITSTSPGYDLRVEVKGLSEELSIMCEARRTRTVS